MSEGIGAVDFDRVKGYLSAALEYTRGEMTLQDVREGIDAGRLQLWAGPSSAIVTEVFVFPHQRVLHFYLAGGNLPELEAMLAPILAWGKDVAQCTRATLTGREGWSRSFLKKLGWTQSAIVMETIL